MSDLPHPHQKILDISSTVTVVFTIVLFVFAAIAKGLTHDLLLEVAIFLVSVKLILLGRKNEIANDEIARRLERIEKQTAETRAEPPPPRAKTGS